MTLLRSLMFVPGNRESMIDKAARFTADVIVLDLEDSAPPDEKAAAREIVARAIPRLTEAGQTVHVRVNSLATRLTRDDLAAVVTPGLAGVLLPKVESAQDIRDLDVLLREFEFERGIRPGSVASFALIESAKGVLRCEAICAASDRLAGLALGAEDLTADLGVRRTTEGRELSYARGVLIHTARAYGVVALDTPYPDFRDGEGLAREAQLARELGMRGKYAIHPDQVESLNHVFAPSAEEIAWARRVVEAYEAASARGSGAVNVDGRMVDEPVAKRAQDLLAQAEAIARREGQRGR